MEKYQNNMNFYAVNTFWLLVKMFVEKENSYIDMQNL